MKIHPQAGIQVTVKRSGKVAAGASNDVAGDVSVVEALADALENLELHPTGGAQVRDAVLEPGDTVTLSVVPGRKR